MLEDVDDYWAARRRVAAPAHNPRPRAPEHIGMVNNLARGGKHAKETHIPDHKSKWKRLRAHIGATAASLSDCDPTSTHSWQMAASGTPAAAAILYAASSSWRVSLSQTIRRFEPLPPLLHRRARVVPEKTAHA